MRRHFVMAAAIGITVTPIAAGAQQHDHAAGGTVGSVHMPTSCSAKVQPRFDRAVAMLHSFWFEQAAAEFGAVAEADPKCAMAHWGTAMTLWGNPMTRSAPSAERTATALEAIAKAEALFPHASARERRYIEAAAVLYRDHESLGHLERMRRHEEAMAAISAAHPDDPEAAIFHGRIVVANAAPDDLTFARQQHAATILNPLFESQPDHPGLAHYIIHAFDAPPIASMGLAAAKRYAEIAPAAPHALHMPSHIFTRLGYWDESIETNRRSAEAEPNPNAAVHPMDYMVYAFLQQGRDAAAREVVDRAMSNEADRYYGGILGYNSVAMPARYALERERWADAAALPAAEGGAPYVEALARFARAVGAARDGKVEPARLEVARMGELHSALEASGDKEWATRVAAQKMAAEAWIAHLEGRHAESMEIGKRAADLDESVEKHPVTPGPLLPARELYGDLLMMHGKPAEALAAYEATLKREPRRARSLFGAIRAAEKSGNTGAVAQHAAELRRLMQNADASRPEQVWLAAYGNPTGK